MPKLYMEKHEIQAAYRDAADKNEQIKILAQLNACKPQDIIEVLDLPGFPSKKASERSKGGWHKGVRWDEKNVELLKKYLQEGCSNLEIAERIGSTKDSVAYQIHARRLKGLRGKKTHEVNCEKKTASSGGEDIDAVYIKQLEKQIENLHLENTKLKDALVMRGREESAAGDVSSGMQVVNGLAHVVLCVLKSFETKGAFDEKLLDGAIAAVAHMIVTMKVYSGENCRKGM